MVRCATSIGIQARRQLHWVSSTIETSSLDIAQQFQLTADNRSRPENQTPRRTPGTHAERRGVAE